MQTLTLTFEPDDEPQVVLLCLFNRSFALDERTCRCTRPLMQRTNMSKTTETRERPPKQNIAGGAGASPAGVLTCSPYRKVLTDLRDKGGVRSNDANTPCLFFENNPRVHVSHFENQGSVTWLDFPPPCGIPSAAAMVVGMSGWIPNVCQRHLTHMARAFICTAQFAFSLPHSAHLNRC